MHIDSTDRYHVTKIFTPEEHICICEVITDADGTIVALRFKKAKGAVYECVPLERLLDQIYHAAS